MERAWALGDLCFCVLQGEGCCLAARRFSPVLGLPATRRKGIGKQPALPGLECLSEGQWGGEREIRQGEGPRVAVGSVTWSKRGCRAFQRG